MTDKLAERAVDDDKDENSVITESTFKIVVQVAMQEYHRCAASGSLPTPDAVEEDVIRRTAKRLSEERQLRIGGRPRNIDTVDFATVLTALTVAGREAAADSRDRGLKPAGRSQ